MTENDPQSMIDSCQVVRTSGVDLAAEPRKTALAILEWRGARAAVTDLRLGVTDAEIADVAPGLDSLGIDCAFGWPDDFVKFVADHARGERVDRSIDEGSAWRKRLSYRQTDRAVHAATGRWPLSVATNLLGLTAMHCAALLDLLGETLGPIDRSGGGRVAEVYPGAMLRLWGFDTVGYKKDVSARAALLEEFERRTPWLDIPDEFRAKMLATDDSFDAVIAALGARAHQLGKTIPVPAEFAEQAQREGWIALPTIELEDLALSTT